MNGHVQAQIDALKRSEKPATAPKLVAGTTGKGATPKARSAKEIEAERLARLEVVGVGRYAGHYTSFGVVQPYRKYILQNEEQAQALDDAFYSITGTKP